MKKLFTAGVLAACMSAQAGPNKAVATTWGNDFEKAKAGLEDALILRDAVGPTRGAMRRNLESLEQRAAKMWGDPRHECALAARLLINTFDETLPVMRGGGHIPTASLTRFALLTGSAWADCTTVLDAVK